MTISPKKKKVINKVAGKLRKASQAHASQAKTLSKLKRSTIKSICICFTGWFGFRPFYFYNGSWHGF